MHLCVPAGQRGSALAFTVREHLQQLSPLLALQQMSSLLSRSYAEDCTIRRSASPASAPLITDSLSIDFICVNKGSEGTIDPLQGYLTENLHPGLHQS